MVKMIFSDFDSTMLDYHASNERFDSYKIEVLKRIKARGIGFSIVTGRGLYFFYQFPELLENISYIISSNGGCIYDMRNKKFVETHFIDNDILKQLVQYAIAKYFNVFLNTKEQQILLDQDNIQYYNLDCIECEQVILSFPKENLFEVENFIEGLGKIVINNKCEKLGNFVYDLNIKGVNKGNSIQYLCNYLGINQRDTVGFGDSSNDLSMFQAVGKSVAVGNAAEEIKEMADEVIGSCLEDGIYKYIEQKILK